MNIYYIEIDKFLFGKAESKDKFTDGDVILMVMNIINYVTSHIYNSLKILLPETKIDYDFLKVKLINSLSDEFDSIKDKKIDVKETVQ